jgi:hypothetical protein
MKRLLIPLLLIAIVCTAQHRRFPFPAASPYLNSTDFILWDEFSVATAAGSVNGTTSESGATRTVTDTESKLSITGGNLSLTSKTAPSETNPWLRYSDMTRAAGLMFVSKVASYDLRFYSGWYSATSTKTAVPRSTTNSYLDYGLPTVNMSELVSDAGTTNIVNYAVLRATGSFYFAKYGALTSPRLLYIDDLLTTTPVFPAFAAYNGTITYAFLRIPRTLWLPTPLVSDGFPTAFGTSSGTGHAETSGLGSGGAGKTWTARKGSYSVSAGKAIGDTTGSLVGVAIATVDVGVASTLTSADLVRDNASVGIVVRYVDSLNYIVGRHNGTAAELVRVTAGSETVLKTGAATYAASATIRIISSGSTLSLFYNNAKVSTDATETQGLTSTLIGVYNIGNGSNTIDNVTSYPRGLEGQFSILNTWSANP